MKQFTAVLVTVLPLLVSSYYVKVGILSHDLDPDTTKKIWSMAQNFSTMMSLEPVVEMAQWKDVDNAAKMARCICNLVKEGIDALVFLGSHKWNPFISSYAERISIPFIAAGLNPANFNQYGVCMLPDTTEAAADLIIRYGWDNFIFLYDSDNGPDNLQKILSSLLSVDFIPQVNGFWKVDSVAQAMHYLVTSASLERTRFLLATSESFADTFINSVEKSDLMLLTPVGTIKNAPHRTGNTLIKFSVVDAEDPVLVALENRLKTLSSFLGRGKPGKDIPDSAILHYDSSSTLNSMFNKIARENPSDLNPERIKDCFELVEEVSKTDDFLKEVYIEHGATGKIAFDRKGRRHDYTLNIMQSSSFGNNHKVGTWSDRYGLQMLREMAGDSPSPTYAAYESKLPIKVTSIIDPPFLRMSKNGSLEGYAVDFLDELSKVTKFDYKLQLVSDERYGFLQNGKWVGMIGELIRGEADIAVAPLTKTLERQKVIDFSKNIMTIGLNILMKKPQSEMKSASFAPFTFLSIWSAGIWIAIIVVVAIYSAGNYGISKFIGSPDRVRALESKGTDNLSPCGGVWFTVGSLFCRDTGIYPRYLTHRLWALLWWIFCIFIGLLYVSMLTATLTKVRTTVTTTHSRKTSQEVLKQYVETGFPVIGAVETGSTARLFKSSSLGLYQQYGRLLEANPMSMTSHGREGFERVKKSNGDYAFITESSYNEFIASTNCDTFVTPGYLITRPYAVAFPKNSSLKVTIDQGVIHLMETGKLRELYEKWWYTQRSTCEDPALNILPKVYNTSLTLYEVSGVFYLFILFTLLSIVAAAVEYYLRTRNVIVR